METRMNDTDLAERIEFLEAAIPYTEKMQALSANAYAYSKASGLHSEIVTSHEAGIERLAQYRDELRAALEERDGAHVRL
jgi:hypothetical protein